MRTKSILAVMLMSIIVMQSFTVMANTIRKEVVWDEDAPASAAVLPAAGLVAAGLLYIMTIIGLKTYSGSGHCDPSPLCGATYCDDNPSVCRLFKNKQIDCCNGDIRTVH